MLSIVVMPTILYLVDSGRGVVVFSNAIRTSKAVSLGTATTCTFAALVDVMNSTFFSRVVVARPLGPLRGEAALLTGAPLSSLVSWLLALLGLSVGRRLSSLVGVSKWACVLLGAPVFPLA
jgi:hypothetical protein